MLVYQRVFVDNPPRNFYEGWLNLGQPLTLDVRNFVQRALFEGAPPPENTEKTAWLEIFLTKIDRISSCASK